MPLGFVDILTILLVTVGPLKALVVFGTLTATAEPEFRRRVADRTVTVAAIVPWSSPSPARSSCRSSTSRCRP
jgi:small neutral amino acid transporter SnatA (MarC family)